MWSQGDFLKRSACDLSDGRPPRTSLSWFAGVFLHTVSLVLVVSPAPASGLKPAEPLLLVIRQVTSMPRSGLLKRFDSTICLQVQVTNQSDIPLTLNRVQIQLLCENDLCRHIRSPRTPLLLESEQQLDSGEAIEGWVAFQVMRPVSEEPMLQLTWQLSNTVQTLSLNQVIRDLVGARTVNVGFEKRIAVLSIRRSIDLMTMWVLDEHFRALNKQGVQRLVLDASPGESQRLPPNISNWLQLANGTATTNRRTVVRGFPAPVQFREFHVTGFQYRNSTSGKIMHRSREQAVAAAARTLYEQVPVNNAMAEFGSPEAGIRRAAMESSIDRLPAADLADLLNLIPSGSVTDQQLVLELLDRISDPLGVETLRTTLLSYLQSPPDTKRNITSNTAAVAARTLVRCIVPQTDTVVREIWTTANDDRALRDTMIREILRTNDPRWTKLMSQYAAEQLDHFAANQSSTKTGQDSSVSNSVENRVLRDVLSFLHDNDTTFIDVARHHLMNVRNTLVHDELLRIVIHSGETALACDAIALRVERRAVTKPLLGMIHRLPDSDWTMHLYEYASSEQLPRHLRTQMLMTAIRCATDQQLDIMIDDADRLDRAARSQLFQQLMTMNHPRCAELLKKSLDGNETEFSAVLNSLPLATSPEMLQLVVNRFELFRQKAVEQKHLEGSSFRMATKLLVQLAAIDHPEARRMINLSMISPERGLRMEAVRQLSRSNNRSRTRTYQHKQEIRKLKRQGDYDKAKKRLDRLIDQDPFYSDFLVSRASLYLRNGQIEAARADILEANRLSPADVFTESTLALVQVRSGQIKEGLKYAELVLNRVPPAAVGFYQGTLYNTACTYSRALEFPNLTSERKQQYLARAMDLMQQSAEAGFYDERHVLNDPDLMMLHNHPDWAKLIGKITTNKRSEEPEKQNN